MPVYLLDASNQRVKLPAGRRAASLVPVFSRQQVEPLLERLYLLELPIGLVHAAFIRNLTRGNSRLPAFSRLFLSSLTRLFQFNLVSLRAKGICALALSSLE
jgi:hypothetical protein